MEEQSLILYISCKHKVSDMGWAHSSWEHKTSMYKAWGSVKNKVHVPQTAPPQEYSQMNEKINVYIEHMIDNKSQPHKYIPK